MHEVGADLRAGFGDRARRVGIDGERGIPYASWGIGVAENSEHKDAAFKLYLAAWLSGGVSSPICAWIIWFMLGRAERSTCASACHRRERISALAQCR